MLLPSFSPIKMEVCWEWHFTAQQGEIIKKDNILTQTSYSFPLLLVSSLSDLQKIKIKVKIILVLLGHNSFLWLPLCSTCQQSFPSLLWLLSPSHHPGVCLLFFQALSSLFPDLDFVPRLPFPNACRTLLGAAQTHFLHLISPRVFILFILGFPSLFCLFSLLRVAHHKHCLPRGDFKSLFLMQANCHTEMCTHTSSYVTKPLQRAVH